MNPLMAYLIRLSPNAFIFIKNTLVGIFGGMLLTISLRKEPEWSAKTSVILLVFVLIYTSIILQHVVNLL